MKEIMKNSMIKNARKKRFPRKLTKRIVLYVKCLNSNIRVLDVIEKLVHWCA
jgi:hypothetical protein